MNLPAVREAQVAHVHQLAFSAPTDPASAAERSRYYCGISRFLRIGSLSNPITQLIRSSDVGSPATRPPTPGARTPDRSFRERESRIDGCDNVVPRRERVNGIRRGRSRLVIHATGRND